MRINKHSRPWALAGRRLFRERLKNQNPKENNYQEEGNTLLENAPLEKQASHSMSDTVAHADPTQRLLTVLGRFNRFVSLAEKGNAHDNWPDECMEQLIVGIEIALSENWVDVKNALTDTARILQSYEDAGCPSRALPFMKKSYEALCLMVGDLIVGNIRSGVVQKWLAIYAEAVEDLQRAGISLVDDEGGESTKQAKAPQLNVLDKPIDVEQAMEESLADDNAEEEFDGYEDDAFFEEDEVEGPPAFDPTEAAVSAQQVSEGALSPAFDDLPMDIGEFESISEASNDENWQVAEMSSEVSSWQQADETLSVRGGSAEEMESGFDTDDQDEAELEENVPETSGQLESDDALDEEYDVVCTETAPVEPSLGSLPPIPGETAHPQEEQSDDNIIQEQTDASMGGEAQDETQQSTSECTEEAEQEEEVNDDAAEVEIQSMDDPMQELLRVTNVAISKGNVAEAKVMALQLAVQMAELEEQRAAEHVNAAEHELERILSAIHESEQHTRHAEQRLNENSEQVAKHNTGILEKVTEIAELRQQVCDADRRMADLDEQIRILQEKRADEAQLGAELQADMEMAIYLEGQMTQELTQLMDAEQAARIALEHAKKQAAHLEQNRERQEALILDAEAEVARQRNSLSNIRKTIDFVMGVIPEEEIALDISQESVQALEEGPSDVAGTEEHNNETDLSDSAENVELDIQEQIQEDEGEEDAKEELEEETEEVAEQAEASEESTEGTVEIFNESDSESSEIQASSDSTGENSWENTMDEDTAYFEDDDGAITYSDVSYDESENDPDAAYETSDTDTVEDSGESWFRDQDECAVDDEDADEDTASYRNIQSGQQELF